MNATDFQKNHTHNKAVKSNLTNFNHIVTGTAFLLILINEKLFWKKK